MTEEEKKEYKNKLIADCKTFNHIDYDDDVEIVELMVETVFEEMTDLIPNFNQYQMTSRQRLLTLVFVKELYDNREKYKDGKGLSSAVSSMLLKEKYGGSRS